MANRRKIMFLLQKAPHGTIYALEGLEAVLIFCAYEQEITVLFMDDGIYSLKKGQDTTELGTKEFSATYRVLDDYGVTRVCVDKASMGIRGLRPEDLIIDVEFLTEEDIILLMKEQDVILPF
jgi:tRNA 2-thiouridine synthesizing protein C